MWQSECKVVKKENGGISPEDKIFFFPDMIDFHRMKETDF